MFIISEMTTLLDHASKLGNFPYFFTLSNSPLNFCKTSYCAEKKCNVYMRDNLRVPTWKLMLQWGRQLRMDTSAIKNVSEKLSLRHALGHIPFS